MFNISSFKFPLNKNGYKVLSSSFHTLFLKNTQKNLSENIWYIGELSKHQFSIISLPSERQNANSKFCNGGRRVSDDTSLTEIIL